MRWRTDYQNDFAARMDWCVKTYRDANHHPVAVINGDETKNVLQATAVSGRDVILDASASRDPDGDDLSFFWWVYPEPGSAAVRAQIQNDRGPVAAISLPPGDPGGTIHVVLEVRDNGSPSLVSYRRIVFNQVTDHALDEGNSDQSLAKD